MTAISVLWLAYKIPCVGGFGSLEDPSVIANLDASNLIESRSFLRRDDSLDQYRDSGTIQGVSIPPCGRHSACIVLVSLDAAFIWLMYLIVRVYLILSPIFRSARSMHSHFNMHLNMDNMTAVRSLLTCLHVNFMDIVECIQRWWWHFGSMSLICANLTSGKPFWLTLKSRYRSTQCHTLSEDLPLCSGSAPLEVKDPFQNTRLIQKSISTASLLIVEAPTYITCAVLLHM